MNNIREIIFNNINPWTEQLPNVPKEEIYNNICQRLDNGLSYAVEQDGLVVLFNAENKYLCRIHLFSECKSYKIVRAVKNIFNYMFENTDVQKFYGMFENRKICSYAKKAGWSFHGEITESVMTENDGMQSLYVWGISRSDYERQKATL